MSDRSLIIKNLQEDLQALLKNKSNLQVAKSVLSNNELIFNVVWQSSVLAPTILFKWKPVYGLNWTMEVPESGTPVTLGGMWKQCDQGQVIDLDTMGLWTQSTTQPEIGFMKIGKNKYKTGLGNNGIHFVIGIQEASGNFSPIFVDPVETGPNMSAIYQPSERVQWWYQVGMQNSTMISKNTGVVETGDFSKPDPSSGTYSKTSSYIFKEGHWKTDSP